MSDKEKLTKELILSLVWDMPRHNMEMATDVSDNAEWLYKKLRCALTDTADALPEPTEEMIKRGAESLAASANRPVADWRRYKEPARWALRAALAVAQKEG